MFTSNFLAVLVNLFNSSFVYPWSAIIHVIFLFLSFLKSLFKSFNLLIPGSMKLYLYLPLIIFSKLGTSSNKTRYSDADITIDSNLESLE